MFGEDHHDSIVQRGIDEAFACQDMLMHGPRKPSWSFRMITTIAVATRAIARRSGEAMRHMTSAAPRGTQ